MVLGLNDNGARSKFKQKGKLEAAPRLLNMGLSVVQIAQALELEVEESRLG